MSSHYIIKIDAHKTNMLLMAKSREHSDGWSTTMGLTLKVYQAFRTHDITINCIIKAHRSGVIYRKSWIVGHHLWCENMNMVYVYIYTVDILVYNYWTSIPQEFKHNGLINGFKNSPQLVNNWSSLSFPSENISGNWHGVQQRVVRGGIGCHLWAFHLLER